jgi:site-specific recombinase XerD
MAPKNKSSFGLLFYINRSKTKLNGQCPVMLRVTINGKNVALRIKRYVLPENWDPLRSIGIGKSAEIQSLNLYIDAIRARAYNKYTELLSLYDDVTPAMLRDAILGINTSRAKFLIEEWEKFCADLKMMIGKGSSYANFQKYNTCKNFMKDFLQKEYQTQDVSLKSIDRHLITQFELYLRTVRSCNHNTATKYLQKFRKIVLIGFKNEWIKINPFDGIKLNFTEVDRPYLTEQELTAIMERKFALPRLENVRDLFVFSCFTGLSYIDVQKLTKGEMEQTPDGRYWIKTRRQKTNVKAHIPLLPIAISIINKYTDFKLLSINDRVIPIISNQKMNAYLKEVADLCGIEKHLSFHVARHTFATTVTMMNGVPIETVSRMLGHKNIKSTQHYARIVDTKIGEDMCKLESILEKKLGFGFV